jgi:hypothetical protein
MCSYARRAEPPHSILVSQPSLREKGIDTVSVFSDEISAASAALSSAEASLDFAECFAIVMMIASVVGTKKHAIINFLLKIGMIIRVHARIQIGSYFIIIANSCGKDIDRLQILINVNCMKSKRNTKISWLW